MPSGGESAYSVERQSSTRNVTAIVSRVGRARSLTVLVHKEKEVRQVVPAPSTLSRQYMCS